MPNRGIKESITSSETLAQLSAEEERHFYRLLVQADDFGRFDARLYVIRANGYKAMLDKISERDVELWTAALVKVGLISLYGADGRPYGVFLTWERHQRRRAERSRFPDPLSDDSQPLSSVDTSCQPLPDDNSSQQPLTDVAVTRDTSHTHVTRDTSPETRNQPTAAAAVFQAYQNNIGSLTPHIADQLRDLIEGQHAPPEWVVEAIGIAVEHNARSLSYVKRIVERWLTEGKDNGRPPANQRGRPRAGTKHTTTEPSPYAAISIPVDV